MRSVAFLALQLEWLSRQSAAQDWLQPFSGTVDHDQLALRLLDDPMHGLSY
jgi:hypothetical protein